jgi:aspartyl-tRNA(Asn)/glutamyl-tRNA(Gln) amidotransferase subunit C
MPVTKEDIVRTAGLARLALSPKQLDAMTETLGKVFQYIDQLQEVDTTGVEPLHHVLEVYNIMDPDVPRPCLSRDEALANAPDRTEEYFRLPRVIN